MSSASRPVQPKRLLLAEEQPGSRDLIILVLSRLGYSIVPTPTLASALELLGQHPCTCVLLSSSLPDCSGAEAVQRIRASTRGGVSPAIFVLGTDDEALRTGCLEAGAHAYLLRPIEIERLLRLLKRPAAPRAAEVKPVDSSEPVVDLEHLSGFTDGDQQLERELAALYLSSAGVYLQRMRAAVQDRESWRSIAHALRGASSNLGARRVATLAGTAERSNPDEALLATIGEAVDDVRCFFDGRRASA